MYHDVIRLDDAQKLLNCSLVQVISESLRIRVPQKYATVLVFFPIELVLMNVSF